jgi:hypothetical protein
MLVVQLLGVTSEINVHRLFFCLLTLCANSLMMVRCGANPPLELERVSVIKTRKVSC